MANQLDVPRTMGSNSSEWKGIITVILTLLLGAAVAAGALTQTQSADLQHQLIGLIQDSIVAVTTLIGLYASWRGALKVTLSIVLYLYGHYVKHDPNAQPPNIP